jgi:outer membrane protein TolC
LKLGLASLLVLALPAAAGEAPEPAEKRPAAEAKPQPEAPAAKEDPAAKDGPAEDPRRGVKLTVAQCVEIALLNNVDLRRQRLRDRQAGLDQSSALAEFLPTLTASGTRSQNHRDYQDDVYERRGSAGLSTKTPWGTKLSTTANQSRTKTGGVTSSTSSIKAELRQPLLHGAGLSSAFYGYRSARHRRVASREDLTRQIQSTVFNIRRLYWAALKNGLEVQASRRALASANRFLEATEARLKAERASKLDVSNAEIQRSTREVALTGAEANLEDGLDSLKEAMDVSLSERLLLTSVADYKPARRDRGKLLKQCLRRRPDLRAARERLQVQRLDLARHKRESWPNLDLVGGYLWSGSGEGTDDSHNYNSRKASVGLELNVPLGNVKRRYDLRKAALELRREELGLHRLEVSIERELRSVLRDLRAAERNLASFVKRVAAAKLAAAAARELYARGKASSFDVVRAEDDLLDAELGLARSRADCLTLAAQLDLVSARPVSELAVDKAPADGKNNKPSKGK